MDWRAETKAFLRARRAAVDPSATGVPIRLSRRRVAGLRREEVALLAGISVDYYTLLERGSLNQASDPVVAALARALRLDDADTAHLWLLARRLRHDEPASAIPDYYAELVRRLGELAGCLVNFRHQVLAWNAVWLELHRPLAGDAPQAVDIARLICSEAGRAFYVDWPARVWEVAAMLRTDSARFPDDPYCLALVAELLESCPEFRRAWEACAAGYRPAVSHAFQHPAVGLVETERASLRVPGVAGAMLVVFLPKPSSAAAYRHLAESARARTAAAG
jgi:transcriptional regulator with XRE-family HTH domain